MPRTHPEIVIDDDNPEWKDEDFSAALPLEEMPADVVAAFPNTRRRGQNQPTKVKVSMRLSREVVDRYRSSGSG